ncbi:MAG: pimeloyl-ACP methyl ester esterase BioH [Betaproteobacteria bacterium]
MTRTDRVQDLVLLHGWGTNAGVWRMLAEHLTSRFQLHTPALPYAAGRPAYEAETVDEVAERLASRAPERCAVCGWSLGALVALAWAARAPRQVCRLALIAGSPCFVRKEGWPHAIAAATLQDFARDLARDTARTLNRYVALQARGDARAASVARYLRETLSATAHEAHAAALQHGLSMLSRTDLRPALNSIAQPTLVMHGERDAIAPLAAGRYLARALPEARIVVMEGAAHAPFVSEPEQAYARLASFFDEG